MMDFLLNKTFSNFVALAGEYILILWFFRPLESRTEGRWQWAGYLCPVLLAYLYFTPNGAVEASAVHSVSNFMAQAVRMLIHWLAVFGYLVFTKEGHRRQLLYHAGFFTLIYLTAQNLRVIAILTGKALAFSESWGRCTAYFVVLVELTLCWLISKKINIAKIESITNTRWVLIVVAALLELYFKWSLITMQAMLPKDTRWIDMLIFASAASLSVFLLLFLFEINQQEQEMKRRAELERVSLDHEMQNAKRALQTNNDIRRLYHDMKHHLLALRGMAGEESRVEAYLDELLPRFEGYESQVTTGNPVVDALLSEKIQRAALDKIQFNIYMDLSGLEKMKSVDLITIFGNAVDNAIEAAQALPDGVERIVYLKSSRMANLTVLRFSNQFTGERLPEDGTLLTRKTDKVMHGIGLSSIQKAAKRYGGTVTTRVDNEQGWFSLMVLLPDQ